TVRQFPPACVIRAEDAMNVRKVLVLAAFVPAVAIGAAACKSDAKAETGVVECDTYLKKAEACEDKVPAADKARYDEAMKSAKDRMKAVADSPSAREQLRSTCKESLAELKKNPSCT